MYGSKNGDKRKYYELSYEEARTEYYRFRSSENWEKSSKALRISLWLDNAMFGNLHIFVIDFDEFDVESHFFKEAHRLADKVTRSQGGGYHMFYGVDKEKAEPLFDSINLLASENAASFVCKTGAVTRDGANKVDLFCDKLQILPYSERYRAIFYFRRKYKMPPPLENGNEIVKFIQFALRYTTNIELSQNWQACLDVSNTEKEAAALLAYYGWAPNLKKDLPRTENAFYTVEAENGVRHYEIVPDDITLRFEAIQQEARINLGVPLAIRSTRLVSVKSNHTLFQYV